jgi:hypothetical protein
LSIISHLFATFAEANSSSSLFFFLLLPPSPKENNDDPELQQGTCQDCHDDASGKYVLMLCSEVDMNSEEMI